MRIREGAPSIASGRLVRIIHGAIAASHKPTFRIVEFNILSNHLHLLCEAENKVRLARGVQGFAVRLVRRLNSALIRSGKLLAHRYHARALKTPREVRLALRYVLLNRKHHAAEKRFAKGWIDPCSSAAWFGGWGEPIAQDEGWIRELCALPSPTMRAVTWLLRVGWRRYGPLGFDETPG